jgi:uncharacterized protein
MKKFLVVLTILFAGISSFAQVATDSVNISAIASDSIPRTKGWVSDFEGIYTKPEVKTLDSLIGAFEKKTGYEIAIITVDANWTTDSTFDRYILAVANAWGVGKKGKDNGIVIGISSEFRSIRIVNGAGVTVYLSDDATKEIIDTVFIANFKEGNYFKGTKEGLLAIMKKLK